MPVVHICTVTPISMTVGANRIVPAIAIPHPLGNPALSKDEEKALRRHQMPHKLINYPKDPRLTHAFSAFYPELPESREVIHHLIHFFEHTGEDCKGGYVS